MRKKTTVLALATLLLLLGVTTVAAVTWGEPAGDLFPHVGTLIFQQPSGYYSCSGTLLTPTVMLTAGHCTGEAGQANLATWVSFDSVVNWPDFGGDRQAMIDFLNANWIKGTAHPHPQYSDFSEWPNTYDVGVVILDTAQERDEYGTLPPLGLLDQLTTGKGHKDRRFTVVGYGMQGYVPGHYQDDWERYYGTVSVVEVKSALNGDDHSAKFTSNPGKGNGSGGSCYGDSGGPVFKEDTNMVGAVVSWGQTPCVGIDFPFRMDTPVAQDFVKQYLP